MRHPFKRFTSIFIAFVMMFTVCPVFGADFYDNTADSWAIPEIEEAVNEGLTYPQILNNFKKAITREEFCVIAVKLYEKISGQKAVAAANPFSDTTNPEILKAYQLGIVNGVGNGKFAPNSTIIRQDLCKMVAAAIHASMPSLDMAVPETMKFKDSAKIRTYALEHVKFCVEYGIVKGTSLVNITIRGQNPDITVDPMGITPRQQAIIIINRAFENIKDADMSKLPTIEAIRPGTAVKQTEREKFDQMDWKNRLVSPTYDTKLQLYVANGPGKPKNEIRLASKPAALRYVQTHGTFIDKKIDSMRYFSYSLKVAGVSKVVWQISTVPFNGYPRDWKKPAGLIKSGELATSTKEFVIDFSSLTTTYSLNTSLFTGRKTLKTLPMGQRCYYVRAVPVNSAGDGIGDPGVGLQVIYGKAVPSPRLAKTILSSFELWYATKCGIVNTSGEFPTYFKHDTGYEAACVVGSNYSFQIKKLDSDATKLTIQVATVPFTNEPSEWDTPEGLIYSKQYDAKNLPDINSGNYQDIIEVPFKDFGPSAQELGTDKRAAFYVRAVAIKDSGASGEIDPMFSDSRKVYYQPQGYGMPKTYPVKQVVVPSYLPDVRVVSYTPVQWQAADWAERYQVYRAPAWNEITCKVKNSAANGAHGDTLYPYSLFTYPGMSPTEYQNVEIPKYIQPGYGFTISVVKQSSSFWGDLWDAICDFFSSIVDVIARVADWVSSTYASIKSGLINFVAANFPLIPDSLRDELKLALTALVDTGLASMGIPPSLPNFDDMTSLGMEYAVKVAAEQAGIPASELTVEAAKELANQVQSQIEAASKTAAPNPIDCPFIQYDPAALERPAYVVIELKNPSATKSTKSGWLCGSVTNEQEILYEHSYYVGNNYKKKVVLPVFENVRMPIPALKPLETLQMTVYLKPFLGTYPVYDDPNVGHVVDVNGFNYMYWGEDHNSNLYNAPDSGFSFSITTDLSSAEEAAKAEGLYVGPQTKPGMIFQTEPGYASYSYDRQWSGDGFNIVPCNNYNGD